MVVGAGAIRCERKPTDDSHSSCTTFRRSSPSRLTQACSSCLTGHERPDFVENLALLPDDDDDDDAAGTPDVEHLGRNLEHRAHSVLGPAMRCSRPENATY
ncbi:hypothetical protein CISG_05986 [Coccidioides immitis RMSCC 3703]|uniref:Uncharacterized protein n=2 Tax=Coccidioides immitis TaxID=5501 RepID=A0A0J8QVQ7_COCIT|nr:hypothetical protein CIRG_09748 [Coccidioides immitis RMSCC 2394]KMU76944.1 hypothetical protein CISG_05986 [Coccidioides immitis RMSCC 3703]